MTHYERLQVSQFATTEVINAAFRQLSKTAHPDKGGNEAEFKTLSEAHDVLSDPAKRRAYDAEMKKAEKKPREKKQTIPQVPSYDPAEGVQTLLTVAQMALEASEVHPMVSAAAAHLQPHIAALTVQYLKTKGLVA